jgi:drug/metabolite transporter (DMT)-like permease
MDLSSPRVAAAFAYHVALPQSLSYALWFTLLRRIPATTASLGTLLIPIFGVIGAIVFLDDWPTPLDLAGFALILIAVVADQVYRAFGEKKG